MASNMSWTLEIKSPVAAPRLFRRAIMDWHTQPPKISPDFLASSHLVEGEGGIGSVRQYNFTSAIPVSAMKVRLDFLDADKCEGKWAIMEGAGDGTLFEMATSNIKVEPAANGGSVVKVEWTYKDLPGVDVKHDIPKHKEMVINNFKAAEAYLIANPDVYNQAVYN